MPGRLGCVGTLGMSVGWVGCEDVGWWDGVRSPPRGRVSVEMEGFRNVPRSLLKLYLVRSEVAYVGAGEHVGEIPSAMFKGFNGGILCLGLVV